MIQSGLSPIKRIEYQIDLIPRPVIPNQPAYQNNPEEIKKLQRQVEELMSKGYIRESMNIYVILLLLVPKKNETWRTCVVYRVINNIIVKYKHHIPKLDNMLDELYVFCVLLKIYLKNEYHHINKIKEGNEWKMCLRLTIVCMNS